MQTKGFLTAFVVREWLLAGVLAGLALTSVYLGRLPSLDWPDLSPIFLLFALFVVVRGLENTGFLAHLGQRLGRGGHLPIKLVLLTYLLSMWVTIDVSLVTMIPLVLALEIPRRRALVILVALTAHAGAALTPFGTPQNLFIFSFYAVDAHRFVADIAPLSLGLLAVFLVSALFLGNLRLAPAETAPGWQPPARTWVYGVLLGWLILCVLRLLPPAAAALALAYPLLRDRASLRVDYALLATFVGFIALAGNIDQLLGTHLDHPHHVFLWSALLSQFIGNVPSTLLLTHLTGHWQALLWGSNVGGFGSLMAAMANLIAYRLYTRHPAGGADGRFVLGFVLAGYGVLALGMAGFYWLGPGSAVGR